MRLWCSISKWWVFLIVNHTSSCCSKITNKTNLQHTHDPTMLCFPAGMVKASLWPNNLVLGSSDHRTCLHNEGTCWLFRLLSAHVGTELVSLACHDAIMARPGPHSVKKQNKNNLPWQQCQLDTRSEVWKLTFYFLMSWLIFFLFSHMCQNTSTGVHPFSSNVVH